MKGPYEARLARVYDHILSHPDGDLSPEALARVAGMGRCHWDRVFGAMTGETSAQAVRRLRMHLAACWLVQGTRPLAEIAQEVGYPDPERFLRAFFAQYGFSPAQFRMAPPFRPLVRHPRKNLSQDPDAMYDVTLVQCPTRRLAGLAHRGSYMQINQAFARVSTILAEHQLFPMAGPMVGIFYDAPGSVPEADLRSFAAFELPAETPLPAGLEKRALPAGQEALLLFKGAYTGLPQAYDHLFGTWLPASGREPNEAPSYEVYLNSPLDTAPDQLLTEIHLPLKPT